MAFGLDFRIPDRLRQLEDDARAAFEDVRRDVSAAGDDVARSFEGSAFEDVLDRSGIAGLRFDAEIDNLDDIAGLAAQLPFDLGKPDATGEVPTASAAIGREQAAVGANLAAAPRIVEALAEGTPRIVETRGQAFAVAETYEDPVSGFSAVRLTPLAGGAEIFAVDGLEVGSRADEVAAATLGRLQVGSAEFQAMIADAAAIGLAEGRPVFFTGPSLGGAVAQVAAYETGEAFLAAGRAADASAVQLVTVDALGGRDAAEAINGGTLNGGALGYVTALNLRTEGDVVSRIGSHIGSSLTLPALDAAGNRVTLDAADAHVNVVSLLQNLDSDALYAGGTLGQPAEIGGFAAASNAASAQVIDAWLASGQREDDAPGELQIPGTARFDPTGTVWSLDADDNGSVDIAVRLGAPVSAATQDLVLG